MQTAFKTLLEAFDLTQDSAAEMLGISRASAGKWSRFGAPETRRDLLIEHFGRARVKWAEGVESGDERDFDTWAENEANAIADAAVPQGSAAAFSRYWDQAHSELTAEVPADAWRQRRTPRRNPGVDLRMVPSVDLLDELRRRAARGVLEDG